MDLTAQVNAYCERADFAFWAEPVNAVTNAAFLIAAVWAWRRSAGDPLARCLAGVLFAIGVGSFLFHTLATTWAALADTLPILGFILLYIFAANRRLWGWPVWGAALGAAAFVPFAAVLVPVLSRIPFVDISAAYWPVPILITGYAVALRRRLPATARDLALGAGILTASLVARSLDEPLCAAVPLGTHFLWHLLNAVMLGWMIVVLRRHAARVEAPGAPE